MMPAHWLTSMLWMFGLMYFCAIWNRLNDKHPGQGWGNFFASILSVIGLMVVSIGFAEITRLFL